MAITTTKIWQTICLYYLKRQNSNANNITLSKHNQVNNAATFSSFCSVLFCSVCPVLSFFLLAVLINPAIYVRAFANLFDSLLSESYDVS